MVMMMIMMMMMMMMMMVVVVVVVVVVMMMMICEQEQIEWAVQEGADFIVAETFSELGEAKLALEAIQHYGHGERSRQRILHSFVWLPRRAACLRNVGV